MEYGNKDIIKFLLESSRKNGLPVWVAHSKLAANYNSEPFYDPSNLDYHLGRVGYYFHKGLIAKARTIYKDPLKKGGTLRKHGERLDKRVTKQDHEKALTEVYPNMPERDRKAVMLRLSVFGCSSAHFRESLSLWITNVLYSREILASEKLPAR